MNIFNELPIYAGKYQVLDIRNFTDTELEITTQAVVVPSQYGASVQFKLKNGGFTFIPLDKNATVGVGEEIELTKLQLVTLGKQGAADIYRILA